ncbi:MAG TPA: M48 family metalloprotease [Chloroflexota bacterium]|nr:M48 family metalloprotease [Chloroflexota bacterium]
MPKQSLRTYPHLTDVSFWIIVLVILGVMVAGALGPSPVLMWPTTLTMLILPVRALLARPEKEIRRRQDVQATAVFTQNGALERLQTTLTDLATAVGYPHPIQLIIGAPTDPIYATGSWRRHYLIIGQDTALKLDADLQLPEREEVAKAALLHEIAHFLHRDVQRVGYTRELLRSCFTVIPWWMIFLLGWLGFANMAVQAWLDFDLTQMENLDPLLVEMIEPLITLSPEQRAEIIEKTETISFDLLANYIINAFWTIIWMGFVLWLFFWRRMLRLQEHQADYFVQEIVQHPGALRDALLTYEPQTLATSGNSQRIKTNIAHLRRDAAFWISDHLSGFSERAWYRQSSYALIRLRRWFAYHPTFDERLTFLRNPDRLNEDWLSITLTTLALALALEVLLITPLISYHTSSYVIHFATLAIFALLSVWALPHMVQKKPVKGAIIKVLLLVYLFRLAWICLNLGLILFLSIFMPGQAMFVLNSIAFAGGRFAGTPESLPIDNPLLLILSIIPSYLGLQLLSLLVVVMLLVAYHWLQRQVSTGQQEINWQRWHWKTVVMLSIAATTLLLTPLSAVLQGSSGSLFAPKWLLTYGLGISVGVYLVWRTKSRS